jgi:hypothetical protein
LIFVPQSETSDEPASVPNLLLGIGGGGGGISSMSASNSPFPFCVDFPPPQPPASAAVERSSRDSAAATQMLLFQQLSGQYFSLKMPKMNFCFFSFFDGETAANGVDHSAEQHLSREWS